MSLRLPLCVVLLGSALSALACGGGGGAGGGGAPVTLGPDLSLLAPTNTVTCQDGYPIQINAAFPQPFTAQGATSCLLVTYFNAQPPAAGTVVSANIRVGAVTGPMRFVRMRILEQAGVGPACCSAEQYGAVFTPAANSVTNVPLDFSILHGVDTNTMIAANDWVGLEVLSANVPVPGVWTQNGGPDVTLPNYLWLPALSARSPATPTLNLRSEGSFGGFLPSFNLVFTPR